MITIKIQCGCGQKYAFDSEPIGGRLSQAVACPVCGADGTDSANLVLAGNLPGNAVTTPALQLEAHHRSIVEPPRIPVGPETARTCKRDHKKPENQWIIRSLMGGALASLLIVAWVAVEHTRSGTRKTSGHEAANADGLPHTLTELNAWYIEPPEGQNAAPVYSRGFDALKIGNVSASNLPLLGKGTLPLPGVHLSSAAKSSVAAFLRANRAALDCFEQAAGYQQCRYPIDLTAGFDARFSHLPKVRSAALELELSAIRHAEAHEAKAAADDILAILGLARSLQNEPVLLSQSVRLAAVSVAAATFERVQNLVGLPNESLKDLAGAFKAMEDYDAAGNGFSRALVAERLNWMTLLDSPARLLEILSLPGTDIPADQREASFARLRNGGKLELEQRNLEQTFTRLMDARKASFPERLGADEVIRQSAADAESKKLIILKTCLASFQRTSAREAELLAWLRVGLASVALEQFRVAHDNNYPTNLSQLIPEYVSRPVLDPFDGEPLRYRTTGEGFTLQSGGLVALKNDFRQQPEVKKRDIAISVVDIPRLK